MVQYGGLIAMVCTVSVNKIFWISLVGYERYQWEFCREL